MKCTGCGAALEVDDSQTKADCPYCRMPFIISKPEPQKTTQVIVNCPHDFEIVAGVLYKYKGAATDVVIPDGVVEIANEAFYNMRGITSIKIPDSVKWIGSKRYTFGELGAFFDCSDLKRINIPDSVEHIGRNAPFSGCKNLAEVDISIEKLMSLTKNDLIYSLDMTMSKSIPYKAVLWQRIKQESKNRGICWNCRKPLVLTKNGECFSCWAKDHLIANGPQDFEINNLQKLAIDTLQNYAISRPQDFEIVAGVLKKYKGTATEVVIPDGVVEIANGAFYDMPFITSIQLPDGVKRIGSKRFKLSEMGAFSSCKSLAKINIPDSVELIGGNGSFYGCKSLSELEISTEKLMSLTPNELMYGLDLTTALGVPFKGILLQRIKQESKNRGICWSCRKPLVLTKNGACAACRTKGHL